MSAVLHFATTEYNMLCGKSTNELELYEFFTYQGWLWKYHRERNEYTRCRECEKEYQNPESERMGMYRLRELAET